MARLFSQSDSEEEEFEGFSEDEEKDDRGFSNRVRIVSCCALISLLCPCLMMLQAARVCSVPQLLGSEDNSDVDTGLYSDGEEPPHLKRRSLLVALRLVELHTAA